MDLCGSKRSVVPSTKITPCDKEGWEIYACKMNSVNKGAIYLYVYSSLFMWEQVEKMYASVCVVYMEYVWVTMTGVFSQNGHCIVQYHFCLFYTDISKQI